MKAIELKETEVIKNKVLLDIFFDDEETVKAIEKFLKRN